MRWYDNQPVNQQLISTLTLKVRVRKGRCGEDRGGVGERGVRIANNVLVRQHSCEPTAYIYTDITGNNDRDNLYQL